MEGRLIGPYRLIARLGAGAMGEVWRALDTRLGRSVAIKLLPSTFSADPERRARMLREARAAAAVPHTNVVTLFDIGSDGGEDYLVMELIEGRTLAERLRESAMTLDEALAVAAAVADALAAAHARGILHRDVKAANVMLTRAGHVKVLDFGLAKLRLPEIAPAASPGTPRKTGSFALEATLPSQGGSLDATREGTLLGTPAYFAPEQLQGRLPDERSEVFSLGVLAYEVIARRPPFWSNSFDGLCEEILRCQPEPLEAPARVREVVDRALRLEPGERYPDMASFAAALHALRTHAPVRKPRRWPWLLAAVVPLVAAVAITLRPAARPAAPVDRYLEQALGEFDLFYNDKATASLHAAMRVAPDDPRAYAYLVLTGFVPDDEERQAAAAAGTRLAHATRPRDRALAQAAVTLLAAGPAAARAAFAPFANDLELVFWDAELAFRAQQYDDATRAYERLLAAPTRRFRGRVYDHLVACLIYRNEVARAVQVGDAYAHEFPGEADAVGVQATVQAAAGHLDVALRLAEDALALHESEDTLAGLAKVRALRGELRQAEALYRRAIDMGPDYRRPLRRAALGAVLLMNARTDAAREATAPCLPGGVDATARTATVCLFVAALADVSLTDAAVAELDKRAAARPPLVPYGNPDALARLLRARALLEHAAEVTPEIATAAERLLAGADSLFVAYHLPFLASYGARLHAQVRTLADDPRGAIALLTPVLTRRPADVPVLLQLAMAQAATGDRAAALATVQRVLATWPSADADAAYVMKAKKLAGSSGVRCDDAMAGKLDQIYARLPVPLQHAAVTAFGLRWYWRRFGPGFARERNGFIARSNYSAAQWHDHQTRALRELLRVAATRIPYYQQAWKGLGLDEGAIARFELADLPRLPLLEKDPIRARPEDFCIDGRPPRGATICPTSGSTGTPIRTYWTNDDFRRSLALREARACLPAGVSYGMPRATFSGRLVVSDAEGGPPYYRFNAVERQVYFSAFHLSPRNAAHYVEPLRRHRIRWGTGYSHAWEHLALMMLEQGIPAPPDMRAVITTSEKLTESGRQAIERAFGCKAYQEYGTVEDAVWACEQTDGRLRHSPDSGIVELLRPDGSLVPAGEAGEGEVVATSFVRRSQLFIRYRVGDVAAWAPPVRGHELPVLQEVVGRLEDVVEAPDGRRTVRFHGVFTEVAGVREAQVIQETRDRLRIKVVPSSSYGEATVRELEKRVHDRLTRAMSVIVEPVDDIPRTKAGKFQAVVSLLPAKKLSEEPVPRR